MKGRASSHPARLKHWSEYGYFIVRGFASAAEVIDLRGSCDAVLERRRRESKSAGHTHVRWDNDDEFADPQRRRGPGHDHARRHSHRTRTRRRLRVPRLDLHRGSYQRSPLRRTLDGLFRYGRASEPLLG